MQKMCGPLIFVILAVLAHSSHDAHESISPSTIPVGIERVSDRVVVAECAIGTNVTAIAASRGVVIVDTHLSPGLMQAIKAELEDELGRNDFVYVVNTHGHWDHCSGNQVFPEATIVGHANTPVFMQYHRANPPGWTWRQEMLLSRDREKLAAAEDPEEAQRIRGRITARELLISDLGDQYTLTPPTVTFSERHELELGDLTLQLIYCGEAHSITDIFVYIPEERVVMTGDVFSSKSSFALAINPMNDIPKLLEAIDWVLDRGVDVVVPGHGDTMTGEDLRGLRGRLAIQYADVANTRSAARFLKKMLDEQETGEALRSFREFASDSSAVGYLSEEEFYLLGSRMVDRGRVEEANAVFRLSRELFPESSLIGNGLARSYLIAGDTTSPITEYERAY
ncbi:MAG: MBL fold metallo-hydrolase, partial [Candidatus Krumholzibacteria bacterium]|nr:MBL fold metallo-hydrolase [Candidatus Krumholzibacteria bacterium]